MFGSPASSAGAGSETPSSASVLSPGAYGFKPEVPELTGAAGFADGMYAVEASKTTMRRIPSADIGSAAGPIRSKPSSSPLGAKGVVSRRVQSGLSGIKGEEAEKAERSVRLWMYLLEKEYDFEGAEALKDAFFERIKVPRVSRRASGPAKIGAEPSSERHAQIVPVGARGPPAAKLEYTEEEVFNPRRYYNYIRYKLASEDKGDLLSGLMEKSYALQNGVGNEAELSRLEEIMSTLRELESNRKKEEEHFEQELLKKFGEEKYNAYLELTKKQKSLDFAKRRENAMKAYAIIKAAGEEVGIKKLSIEKARILEARNLVAEIQAKIRAKAGGGRIYTLRTKRRNVRNKEKRRTRKGLVRQGSRPHRKTRRRA
jgi:hypothetical protein